MLRFRAVGREPRGGDAGAGSPGRAHGVPPGARRRPLDPACSSLGLRAHSTRLSTLLSTGRSSAAHRGVVILILHSPFMIPDSSASPGRWLLVHGARPACCVEVCWLATRARLLAQPRHHRQRCLHGGCPAALAARPASPRLIWGQEDVPGHESHVAPAAPACNTVPRPPSAQTSHRGLRWCDG
jgi:hypothetical protein